MFNFNSARSLGYVRGDALNAVYSTFHFHPAMVCHEDRDSGCHWSSFDGYFVDDAGKRYSASAFGALRQRVLNSTGLDIAYAFAGMTGDCAIPLA